MTAPSPVAQGRIVVAIAGALAGAAGWLLADVLPEAIGNARVLLALATGTGAFFSALLIAAGPLPLGRAALAGLIVGAPAAVLMATASFRFDTVETFLETGHPLIALFLMVALAIAYLLAGLRPDSRWFDYPALFDEAWNAVVRTAAGAVFTGLVWAVIGLSDALLGIVGLTVIEDILEIDPVPWLITGAALGLALAVAHEMSDFVSPHLPLQLLRLLLPVVLAVTALFLSVLPFRGLSELFGEFSAAAILMAIALAAATLVSSALDRDDTAAAGGLLRRSAAALALLLPVMAGLAVLAVSERVGQYGWTPDRVAAMCGAMILAAYGAAYAFAVLRLGNWMARIRRANTAIGLLVIVVAGLWLTPVLNPQRISAASQVARFESGSATAASLDLWSIGREWGRAGRRALERLAALEHPESDALAGRLAALGRSATRFEFETDAPGADTAERVAEIERLLQVRPVGATLPPGALDAREFGELGVWLDACRRLTPGGRPGCAAVVADIVPDNGGDEVVLFTLVSDSYVRVTPVFPSDRGEDVFGRAPHPISGDIGMFSRAETLDRIISGAVLIVPKQLNVLEIDGAELVILP